MNEMTCATVRELIPDRASDGLERMVASRMDAHLEACSPCRAELDLVRVLRGGRAPVPVDLAERLSRALLRDRRARGRPWWGITAAAAAALALGIGIASEPSLFSVPELAPVFAADEEAEPDLWLSEDGLLAGAPALEGLSDEALVELLEDLAAGRGGGAV